MSDRFRIRIVLDLLCLFCDRPWKVDEPPEGFVVFNCPWCGKLCDFTDHAGPEHVEYESEAQDSESYEMWCQGCSIQHYFRTTMPFCEYCNKRICNCCGKPLDSNQQGNRCCSRECLDAMLEGDKRSEPCLCCLVKDRPYCVPDKHGECRTAKQKRKAQSRKAKKA